MAPTGIDWIEIPRCTGTPDGWLCSLLGEVQQGPAALKFDSERFRSAPRTPRTNGNVIFPGRKGDARAAYARALELAETDPERQFLARRLEELA